MSFLGYKNYKSTGVDWLREVPSHWQIRRIKSLFEIKKSIANADGFDVLSVTQGGLKVKNIESNEGQLSMDYSKYQVVEPNDFVMNHMDLLTGSVDIASVNGVTSPDYRVFTPKSDQVCDRFFLYLFQNGYRQKIFYAFGQGSSQLGRWRMPTKSFNDFVFPFPPPQEQAAIAAFLDRETSKIDALVAEQKRLIELLGEKRQAVVSHAVTKGLILNVGMKDSGVEWLGEIPEHWQVYRLGDLFGESMETGDETLPILSVSIHTGVSDRELDERDFDRNVTRSEDRTKYKSVQPNDLTYNMMRAWQGGFGTVLINGMVSPAYVVARPKRNFFTAFVEQQLRTPHAIEEMRRHSKGVTDFRLRLYWDEFKSLRVAIPDMGEQATIVGFVAAQTQTIGALSAEAEAAITILQERRSALISGAVTGKIDVRDRVPQQVAAE
ncbi:conserved hypothetical protein [Mesorhizobium prunaredense]|uniref:Type I restriction modification DNA specificity domain-containing protein n=1 Tax=Mesorhizobium prunaredense TaxID=1631249 RepID=A0A1R3UYW6_9HYPH|nr:restriction endonuclease subunit S [Mesorhizobium prunaredense]SIT52819.1 conserved hypothetical protein [Mesorhizobium prunaredense]